MPNYSSKKKKIQMLFLDLLDHCVAFSQREKNSTVLGSDLGGARVTEQGEEVERDDIPLG